MRINEFSIRRYGRLKDTEVVSLDKNFALVYSGHGKGKTLTIDSIIKMLFDRGDRGAFERLINREVGEPDGYLKVEKEDGDIVLMPDQGHIPDINPKLRSSDFRNVFVIHSTDLILDSQAPYYRSVSERISGIRTQEISNIRKAVRDVYYLTKGGQFKNTQGEDNYLKDRYDDVQSLLHRIKKLKKEMEERGFEDYELEARQIQDEMSQIKEKISLFDEARNREKYKKGSKALDSIKEKLDELQELEAINQGDLEEFRRKKEEKERNEEDIDSTEGELEKLKKEYNNEEEKHKKLERELKNLEKTDGKLREDLEPEIRKLEDAKEDFASKSEMSEIINLASWISILLLAITLVGMVLNPVLLFSILTIFFFLSTVGFWVVRFYLKWREGNLASEFGKIQHKASRLGLLGESLEEINSSIKKFRDFFKVKAEGERDSSNQLTSLETKIEGRKDNLESANKAIEEAKEAIKEIKGRSDAANLEDYGEKYEQKDGLERKIDTHKETLNTLFGSKIVERPEEDPEDFLNDTVKEIKKKLEEVYDSEYLDSLKQTESEEKNRKTALRAINRRKKNLKDIGETPELEELIQYWEREITNLSKYENKAKDIDYDEDEYKKLKDKWEDKKEDLEDLKGRMSPIQKALEEIGEKSNIILYLRGDDKLPCETSVDLKKIKERVDQFKKKKDRELGNALKILDIFEEIESEERREIPQILEEASVYFSEFTDQRFEEVKWEPAERELRIKEGGKKRFRDAETLSTGEKDQLYLSVRLALSNKLLEGERGFFILDDPLVRLSPKALKIVLNTLKDISKAGWQILYFTAKGEIFDELTEDIDKGLIQKIPVAGVK